MTNDYVRKAFDFWMRSNKHRFQHPPYIVKSLKKGFVFQFTSVISELHGYINKRGGVAIGVDFQGEPWDVLFDYGIYPRRNSQGEYYCSECVRAYKAGYFKENPILCTSRRELLEQHSFEFLLQWANENLKSTNRLCLSGEKGKGTCAFIKTEEDAITGKWPYVLPILISKE